MGCGQPLAQRGLVESGRHVGPDDEDLVVSGWLPGGKGDAGMVAPGTVMVHRAATRRWSCLR
ncbi:MAG: hypothetical protein ABSA03_07355 [Streptosporangiaceae bacterium]